MKLGLLAALTGIAVAIGMSRKKHAEASSVPAARRGRTPPRAPKQAPVTGAAPQEGVNMKAPPPSPEKTSGGARVTAP